MDFIERMFGISPDGGLGTTELMYFAVLLIIVALFAWRGMVRAFLARVLGR